MNTSLELSHKSEKNVSEFEKKSFMTVKELAEELHVGERTIKNAIYELRQVVAGVFTDIQRNNQGGYLLNYEQATAIKLKLRSRNNLKDNSVVVSQIVNDLEFFALLKKREQEQQILDAYRDRRIAELSAENALMKPKADVYDAICDTETLQDLQTIAVTLKLKNIFKVLCADKILEEKWTNDNQHYYKPLAAYSQYLVLKDGKPWKDDKGISHVRPRVFVTGKGLNWLTKKYSVGE